MGLFLLVIFILLAIMVGLTIHEIGHFVFAKLFKVNVKEFAIGIGPKIYSKQFTNIKFSINLLPIMAFVRIDSKKSLQVFGELRDEYQKEADEYYLQHKEILDGCEKYITIEKNGQLRKQSTWHVRAKYNSYLKKIDKYANFSRKIDGTLIIDEVPKWQQLIIYFGGIFFNLILFGLFYLIQVTALNNNSNPFIQIGDSFLTILKNMVFYNAWTTGPKAPGTSFGSVAEVGGQGGISSNQLPLVIVNYFALFNLMLFLFNFIPIPPLDGYKIVCTIFSGAKKMKIPDKVKTYFEIFGMLLMIYIFITAIVADFLL
ncbi:hypothetical protein D8X55_02885 [Malacoplasma penetrans]|nr:site-2 protease family protein [Malacoplasma penetrans]RXY96690.1 hypothetical protein D8X55_02885 [Malacoplasma penetrans]